MKFVIPQNIILYNKDIEQMIINLELILIS